MDVFVFRGMRLFVFCLTFFFVALPARGSEEYTQRRLDTYLKTWSRLKRDAGYYTESGRWRGGFYRQAKSSEHEHYHCLHHTDTHCTHWNVSEVNSKKRETGTCYCEETDSAYCQRWRCDTSVEYDCGASERPKTCTHDVQMRCGCVQAAMNERYCWRWRCRETSNADGGYQDLEDYACVVGDVTAEYCYRWLGNTSSTNTLESIACECLQQGRGFCKFWRCMEREMHRCRQYAGGWCHLEIAIAVGGGMGLVCFALSLCYRSELSCEKDQLTLTSVFVRFVLLCLPWTTGVLIWGGVFGILWVLPIWGVAFAAVGIYLNRKTINCRHRLTIALSALPGRQTETMDDAASDNSNNDD